MTSAQLAITYVAAATLRPNPWNTNVVSPYEASRLAHSVDRFGMFKPVLVRTLADGALEILGGEHRVGIAAERGEDVPIVNLGRIDDRRAKEISLVDNHRYGTDDLTKLTQLLGDLGDVEELSSFLPMDGAELDMILNSGSEAALAELDKMSSRTETEPAPPRPTASHATLKLRLPVEVVEQFNELADSLCARLGFTDETTASNVGALCLHALRSLDASPTHTTTSLSENPA